ncbi:hypothetical protein E308F_16770 [Moorella sp. E308F]|uniref:ATP-binding protein n=1 Tax=unclassified Neomoorella TaxID=2676739 RepID=UPI0010FFC148|nr:MULTISPECIES: ATP-binding protein [unclassified Moorella (in: firmicutes)]GEA15433.1 hypothetical protein E308F_16770 [Moorella sp. E308F]GEA19707.1 hypothetical protein E306M_28460 [Moorella sp. E306M]
MTAILGTVLTSTYDTFSFQSDKKVPAGTFVATPLGDDAFLLGRVTEAKASRLDATIYEADILRRGGPGKDGGFDFSAPDELADPGAEVYAPPLKAAAAALGLDADPAKSLFVGRAGDLDVCLRPESLFRHVFVGGTTGSGKSHFAGVLVEELAKLHLPAVVIDSQAEYLDLARSLGGKAVEPGRDYAVPLSSLTTEEAARMVAALESAAARDLFMFSFSALQAEITAGRRSGFGLKDLLRRMEQEGLHALRMDGYELRVAMARVEASIKRHRFLGAKEFNLDWAVLLKSGKPAAVDCSSLDMLQLQLVVGATMRELQRLRAAGKVPPFVLFLDEAHLLVPAEGDAPCKQVIRECVRVGRHYGIGVVLITQNPMDVDRKTIAQCNTRAIFALEPDQLAVLRGIKADAAPSVLRGLPKFPRGTCLLTGTYETVRHAVVVRVRERFFAGRGVFPCS